ncbi:MAG: polyprenyl synthetase family protein [Bacteroidales bacterium]|nr:polyprenyl synthetase family protein [Bacteroidales bacterium]
MEKNLADITQCLSKELSSFENLFKDCFHSGNALLDSVLSYTSSLKGKRIRPILTFLTAEIFGKITERTFRSAVIIELLHTASLLHDDVIDNSRKRRNNSTVNALFGDRIAILAGDFLYGKALAAINTKEDFMLMDVFSKIAMLLPQGEVQETDVTNSRDLSEESYVNVIYNKTASLISAAVECGASTCMNPNVDINQLAEFGKNIGMAFQIKDDILDYDFADTVGKGTGNDIREKKITLPFIYCLQTLNEDKRNSALDLFFKDNKTDGEVQHLIRLVQDSGAVERTDKIQKDYSCKALKAVDNMPLNDYSVCLRELVQYLIIRNK